MAGALPIDGQTHGAPRAGANLEVHIAGNEAEHGFSPMPVLEMDAALAYLADAIPQAMP
jgi:hypothetical protein